MISPLNFWFLNSNPKGTWLKFVNIFLKTWYELFDALSLNELTSDTMIDYVAVVTFTYSPLPDRWHSAYTPKYLLLLLIP